MQNDVKVEPYLTDIPFNFLIGDGIIYEGRGLKYQGEISNNLTVSNYNDIGLLVGFMGTYAGKELSELAMSTFFTFINVLIYTGEIHRRFDLISQDQLIPHMRGSPDKEFIGNFRGTVNFHDS